MIQVGQFMDIHQLHQQGHSIRAIAEMTGLARNTIRRVLRGQHSLKRQDSPRSSKLDDFKDYVRTRYQEVRLSAVRLLEEIQPMGYTGSIATLRRFLATLKGDDQRRARRTVRFETAAGQQAQADWASCGRLPNAEGQHYPVYAFTMVLSFSRMLYVRFVDSMKLPVLIDCHQQAFAYFNGWPQSILYDNMKQIRSGPGQLNERFVDFSRHHGFAVKTHRAYRPRTKGKVERVVDYLKGNFLAGRTFSDLDDLNAQGQHWLENIANVRVHATTGRRPIDLFAQEGLTPYASLPPYTFVDPVSRKVNSEAMVHFQGSRYSVPPKYSGETVWVQARGGHIEVASGDVVIAQHRQAANKGQSIVADEHLRELWKVTLAQAPEVPPASLQHSAPGAVQQVPLSCYEEVCR